MRTFSSIKLEQRLAVVITTIQSPTSSVSQWCEAFRDRDVEWIVVGDRKGPEEYAASGAMYLPFNCQRFLPWQLASLLPANHYARKNLGYLEAMAREVDCIYETDDDNAPLAGWDQRYLRVEAHQVRSCTEGQSQWMNPYLAFSAETIWPRGMPPELGKLHERPYIPVLGERMVQDSPIQQGLANLSPDVDAQWRIEHGHSIEFNPGPSIRLQAGCWSPFNSQSTWWWPMAYPLMYLPVFCSFRMTDIWRSFVAQRCLWELGMGVVFHGPEVYQERNQHDLLRDFEQEIPGYVGNPALVQRLWDLPLRSGVRRVSENVLTCYEELVQAGFFPAQELVLLNAWLEDVATVTSARVPAMAA